MKWISLTQGMRAQVSDEDYERVSQLAWHAHRSVLEGRERYYARGRVQGKKTYMHRFLLGATGEQVVDHRNGDTLDNRRENLRACVQVENARNRVRRPGSSKYKGVSKDGSRWRAMGYSDGKHRALGRWETEHAAALAYDEWAKKEHGEFARLNFPEDHEPWL